jgi:DNA-binding transcriptional regulator YhcF (GntR family)
MVQLPDAARHTILFEYDKLKSIREVTKKLGCNRKTIKRWVPRMEQQKQLVELEGRGITH